MESRNLKARIDELKNMWFLTEPAYFTVLCTHKIELTNGINCPIACGGGYIYLNPKYFDGKSDTYLDDMMKLEVIRILLKHPYGRQLPNKAKMYISSNLVIANNMKFKEISLHTTKDYFKTYKYDKECMEVIYDNIKFPENLNNDSKSNGKNNKSANRNTEVDSLNNFDDGCSSTDDAYERSQFWKEDDYTVQEINQIINKISTSDTWGSIPGNIIDSIKNTIQPVFNYKGVFQQFRSTLLSAEYQKTRMKPSRRFGYSSMGSKRKNTTSLLVAVDTSGSIQNDELSLALGFIKGFFKYAVNTLDVIQFDTKVYPETLITIDKAPNTWKITGRGGTNFSSVFEYVQNISKLHYDGVLIVTDGYADVPQSKYLKKCGSRTKYLWVLNSKSNWERFKSCNKFLEFGKCTYVTKE